MRRYRALTRLLGAFLRPYAGQLGIALVFTAAQCAGNLCLPLLDADAAGRQPGPVPAVYLFDPHLPDHPQAKAIKCEVSDTSTLLQRVNSIPGAIGYAQVSDAATSKSIKTVEWLFTAGRTCLATLCRPSSS